MAQRYAEHHAEVMVNAPVHQVYSLFTHFNDFPKFMSFIKEVTYNNDQSSHWVADVLGNHEWDAVNDGWVPDQQIGWRSTSGLENFGKVTFEPVNNVQTKVDVYVGYNPPAGLLGDAGEKLGGGSRFERALENDLQHFARMVDEAPAGSLDPTASNYLFHGDSAAAKGSTTTRQDDTMYDEANTAGAKGRHSVNPPMNDRDIAGRADQTRVKDDIDTGAVPFETNEVRDTAPDYPTTERGNLG